MPYCRFSSAVILLLLVACARCCPADTRGQWPMLRHDPLALGRQTMAGRMKQAPVVLARYETPKTQDRLVPTDLDGDDAPDLVLAFRAGRLKAYDLDGNQLWTARAEGIRANRLHRRFEKAQLPWQLGESSGPTTANSRSS